MQLRMKNLNIYGIHLKIHVLEGAGFTKNQYRGRDCLKRGRTSTVCKFKEGLGKEEEGVFKGELIPQCTLYGSKGYSKLVTKKWQWENDGVRKSDDTIHTHTHTKDKYRNFLNYSDRHGAKKRPYSEN